ncbi:MAG: hypothetical protein ABMB14_05720 [Myxococcota bacterium]
MAPSSQGARSVDGAVGSSTWGNQAAAAILPAEPVRDHAVALAERVAVALRFPPPSERPPVDRLVALVEGSRLSDDRKDAIVGRLRGDGVTAAVVAASVARWLGGDAPALRSALIAALDGFSIRAGGAPDGDAAVSDAAVSDAAVSDAAVSDDTAVSDTPGTERAEQWVAAEVAAEVGLPAAAVRGLSHDLGSMVLFGWDDEEDRGPVGDYAAEESGW